MPVVEPRKARRSLQDALEKNEETIRNYYAESFDISTKDFIAMILLDSIFIIEHLWRTKRTSLKSCRSNGTSSPQIEECFLDEQNPRLSYSILQDLILLENQVPFFVLTLELLSMLQMLREHAACHGNPILYNHPIDTAEDVDLLVEKKVLVNWLGSNKAVAILINRLSHQIVEGNRSRYYELSEQLHGHYENCYGILHKSLFP
uniref:Uncharacterized protein n=1 Tax=Quercus lobata TaxID=97700 RepID=A0A7N2R2W8_QUELO